MDARAALSPRQDASPMCLRRDIVDMLSELPPQIAYACAKTGLLLLDEQLEHYSARGIAEWNAAIDEYFRLKPRK